MVKVKFAYYTEPYEDLPAEPSYFIDQSDVPSLPVHGKVGYDQLCEAGVSIPTTPTYKTWVDLGRPIYRGIPEGVR